MSGDGENGVLKTLVDSLANTLIKLSVRQESIEKDIIKIENAVEHIPEINRVLIDVKADQKIIKEAIDKISEALNKVNEIAKSERSDIRKEITPVSKLAELLRKPLAIIVTLLILTGAALGLFKLAEDTIDKITKPHSQPITTVHTNVNTTVP
ncbi:MAG: hypothetical protein M0R32_03195 [Candidatus Cloacimonetes bacterium]|jgi:GTP1/Obg family GTP-binding protein|nr:hypothetical protein [Candidatus Cloacimonadota bacterium]